MSRKFRWVLTGDGSPSLEMLERPDQKTEIMHHRAGAYAETQYIYGTTVRRALDLNLRSFLSLGLGVGYNELLIAHEAGRRGIEPASIEIESFESEIDLIRTFLSFLRDEPLADQKMYDLALSFFGPNGSSIKRWLLAALEAGSWKIQGSLNSQNLSMVRPAHCILYDAFSAGTSPDLWSEVFLKKFLQAACRRPALLSTYACNGNLKRSLSACGFEVHRLPGFEGKRDCTLATLGI